MKGWRGKGRSEVAEGATKRKVAKEVALSARQEEERDALRQKRATDGAGWAGRPRGRPAEWPQRRPAPPPAVRTPRQPPAWLAYDEGVRDRRRDANRVVPDAP